MLKRLFIKDYKNIDNPEVRKKYGTVSGCFGIITNLILFLIKFVVGIIANSVTIMADAFNNLSDSGSCIVTILGFKLANKPADKEHPYGHARYEYIAGIIISLLILSMGVLFTKSSIEKIFNPQDINLSIATYIVLVIAILGKLVQMLVYLDFSKAINSATIRATAIDARNDILTTSAVLIAMIIMGMFKINIDSYMGLIISISVFFSSFFSGVLINLSSTDLSSSLPNKKMPPSTPNNITTPVIIKITTFFNLFLLLLFFILSPKLIIPH